MKNALTITSNYKQACFFNISPKLLQNVLGDYFCKLSFLSFKANAKTGIAVVSPLNVMATAQDVMYLGCLKTARNPAISVLIPEVS